MTFYEKKSFILFEENFNIWLLHIIVRPFRSKIAIFLFFWDDKFLRRKLWG